jgi:polysaccharide export outer membrane protein
VGGVCHASEPDDRQASKPPATTALKESASTGTRPLASVPASSEANPVVPDDYEIGAGDVVQISVWKEPDASVPSTVVRPDGKISMPLLKEVTLQGLTPRAAEQVITERLSKFISTPDVTVVVTGIHSKKVYMTGAVRKEGPLSYTYRMTVLQAISEAGGVSEYAKRKKIYVLRHENGRDLRFDFDYEAALKGSGKSSNIVLLPGDIVVVPN